MLNFSIMTTAYKVVMSDFRSSIWFETINSEVHRVHLFTVFFSVSVLEGLIWLFFHKDMLLYTKILLGLQCTNLKFLYLDFRGGQLTRYYHSHSGISIPINLNPFGLQKALCTSKQAPTQKRDSFRHNYIPSCL